MGCAKRWRVGACATFSGLALLLALLGCTGPEGGQMGAKEAGRSEPWISSNVIGAVDESTPVDVRDDFYLATCKGWLSTVQVPSDLMSWGSVVARERAIEDELLALCADTTVTDHDVELMRAYMRIDDGWETRDRLGMEPIRSQAERILGIETLDDLTDYLTSEEVVSWGNYLDVGEGEPQGEALVGLTPLVRPGLEPSVAVDVTRWLIDDDMDGEEEATVERDAVFLLERLGLSNSEANDCLDDALELEERLLDAMYAEEDALGRMLEPLGSDLSGRIRSALVDDTYQVSMDRAELIQCAGAFPIAGLLDAYGFGEVDSFEVYDALWLLGLGSVCHGEDLRLLRSHLLVGLVLDAQFYLDSAATYGAETGDSEGEQGYQEDEVDARRVIAVDEQSASDHLLMEDVIYDGPEIATNAYVRHCYAPKTTERVREISSTVLNAWRKQIEDEDWLGEESRAEALSKLDEMDVYVGSTTSLMDTDAISFEGVSSPWEALHLIRSARRDYMVGRILDADAPALWTSPIEVNAYYAPEENAIFVGCGFLGGELFDADAPVEAQLAVVGHTVAHEVGHAFDSTGVRYDSLGRSRLWMSEQDLEAFEGRMGRVQEFLDKIVPVGGKPYDGELVADEMMADIAGLRVVMRIAHDIEGFDYRRFFEDYCIGWRSVEAQGALEDALASDTHPLDATRANVSVMQVDEFYDTYGVMPGDGMYLSPEQRISVW